jgi:hypothetical protein
MFPNCGVHRSWDGGAVGPPGKAPVVSMRDIFILNKIWAQDEIYILVCTLLFEIFYLSLTEYHYWL